MAPHVPGQQDNAQGKEQVPGEVQAQLDPIRGLEPGAPVEAQAARADGLYESAALSIIVRVRG